MTHRGHPGFTERNHRPRGNLGGGRRPHRWESRRAAGSFEATVAFGVASGAFRTDTLCAVDAPETRYARSGDVSIAYQVVGDGRSDLVWIPSVVHHVELSWENPPVARFLIRLVELARLIVFDKRGTGMSDRVSSDTTLETRMDDIRAVMDAAASDRAVVCALGDSGPLAMLFAATYPERTAGLVLINTTPRFVRSVEFSWLRSRGEHEPLLDDTTRRWGEPGTTEEMMLTASPDMSEDDRRAFGRTIRLSVSPGAFRDYVRMNIDVDVCAVLPSIGVPTLILHRTQVARLDVRGARYLADHIPGARLVELEGRNFAPGVGDTDTLVGELRRFLDEIESGRWKADESDRVLSTVLFTDIVGSSEKAAALGDRAWSDVLQQHHELVRRLIVRFRGREVGYRRGRFFRVVRRPGPGDPLRVGDRGSREGDRPQRPCWSPYRRVRTR
jgi:pimeloyl-ACP methyl ester carboxylesterase